MNFNYSIDTQTVINIPVTSLPFQEQILLMLNWAKNRRSKMVCLANVHMLMEAQWNSKFATVLQQADIVSPDGMPLVWMLKLLGFKNQDRVAGMDVFLKLCNLANERQISVFFLGSQSAILDKIKVRIESEFPDLIIAGIEPLPLIKNIDTCEDKELIQRINESGAGLLFLSLGCPKQELWMARHRDKIRSVMIGLGAVFPVYAGIHKRAPHYIRELGLEWLYRLIQEPRRLWQRYSKTIPPFMWLSIQQLWQKYRQQNFENVSNNSYRISDDWIGLNNLKDLILFNSQKVKLGELLVRQQIISESLLLELLEEQEKSNLKLGEIIVNRGILSQEEIDYYLENQNMKLGELLVSKKIISARKMNKLLKLQQKSKKKLGEILVKSRLISPEKLKIFLLEQYWRKTGFWLADRESNIPATTSEEMSQEMMNTNMLN